LAAASIPAEAAGQASLPRVRKGDLKTKAVYLSPLPPTILWFGPPELGESPSLALGIFSFLSKFTSSCARTGLSELPSRAAGPSRASLAAVTSHLEHSSEIREHFEGTRSRVHLPFLIDSTFLASPMSTTAVLMLHCSAAPPCLSLCLSPVVGQAAWQEVLQGREGALALKPSSII
jgi:hypothetical protein